MSAVLPFIKIDSASLLSNYFTRYQICWIEAEDPFHEAKRQVFALAEKSVRIGWTFCDGFKNVRKRLRFPNRDYLFATKDWPSALEYMNKVYEFARQALSACGAHDSARASSNLNSASEPPKNGSTEALTPDPPPSIQTPPDTSPLPSDGRGIKGEGCLASPSTLDTRHSSPWNL